MDTASAMHKSGRYVYVAFTCQQCIEKLLKALYVKLKNEAPPYSHNLNRLAELAEVEKEMEKEQAALLNLLNAYYTERTQVCESLMT